ncbi:MAG: hypothetical protein KBS74_01805 [Clostridiales bacterium]|nr:hypothetical protein [Candidatus Cacconaster stercorequi]
MDERTKEIRRILTGFITSDAESGAIMAAQNIFQVRTDSLFNGADGARYFGLRVEKHQYQCQEKDVPRVRKRCARAFFYMGRRAYIFTAPESLAMLYRPAFHNPTVVTLEAEENRFLLCVYTARTLLASFHIKHTMKKISEVLPEEMKETDVTMTPVCIEQSTEKKHDRKSTQDQPEDEEN